MPWPQLLNNDWAKSTAGIIIGWLLNALSPYLAERRERRKAISRALADLLDIRHRLVTVESVFEEVNKIVEMSPQLELQARYLLQDFIPGWEQLAQRYNEAVSLVSMTDPLLGYELRSKEVLQPILHQLTGYAAQLNDAKGAAFMKTMNTAILREADPLLKNLILRLALKWSPWTRFRTAQRLALSQKLPKSAESLLELLRAQSREQLASAPEPESASLGQH